MGEEEAPVGGVEHRNIRWSDNYVGESVQVWPTWTGSNASIESNTGRMVSGGPLDDAWRAVRAAIGDDGKWHSVHIVVDHDVARAYIVLSKGHDGAHVFVHTWTDPRDGAGGGSHERAR